jgi:hypothetical protein
MILGMRQQASGGSDYGSDCGAIITEHADLLAKFDPKD